MTHRRSMFRCICDVRQTPALVGWLQMMWGCIPATNSVGSMFARQLEYLGIGEVWGYTMILSGAYLFIGSIVNRRDTLTVALFVAATIWTSMSVLFANAAYYDAGALTWTTPVTLSMPILAVSCWFCLLRELLMKPVHLRDRRGQRHEPEPIRYHFDR